jgi:two-component system, LuxR family, sensor kinase FixL
MNSDNKKLNITDVAARLQAIIETAVDGIIAINDRGVIESVNPATCKIFGYEVEEMLGQNVSMLMPQPHKNNHDGYIHNYTTSGERKIIGIGREVPGRKKDGTIFPFWLAVSEFKLGEKRMFTGVVHDMTEQKKAETALREMNQQLEAMVSERTENLSDVVNKLLSSNQQLQHEIHERKAVAQALKRVEEDLREALKKEQELGMLKSRFVSMASHEFRTPLSTILSSASLMIQYVKEEQQDKREKHFQKIRSSVDILTTILDDFLSLSRLEEGGVEAFLEDFDIHDFCKETMDDAQMILKHGQTLKLNHPSNELMVYLDKKLLKLIFINLVSNASKYSDDAAEINCTIELTHNKLQISISDTGIGIPEEEQKHLFDRFFRASNATHIKGTGLGLHIVKRYAELMHGTVNFVSSAGKGSTFTLNFDIKRDPSVF